MCLNRRELFAAGGALAAALVTGASAAPAAARSGAKPPVGFAGRPTTARVRTVPDVTIRPRTDWALTAPRQARHGWFPFTGVVVHHSADARRDAVAAMRVVQAWHEASGSDDVGYHVFIDREGTVWQGRDTPGPGGAEGGRQVVGAHAKGWNAGTFGVCLLGDLTRERPTAAAIDALTRVVAWRCGLAGVDPAGVVRAADGRDLPVVMAHRTVGSTTCPGDTLTERLGAVRAQARSMLGISGPAPTASEGAAPAPAAAGAAGADRVRSVGGWRAWSATELVTPDGRWPLSAAPTWVAPRRTTVDGTGVITGPDGARVARIRPPAWISAAAFAGDGRWWIGDLDGGVHRFDTATGTLERVERLGRGVVGLAVAPGGGWWAVTSRGLAAGGGAPGRSVARRSSAVVGVAAAGDTVAVVWRDGLVAAVGPTGTVEHRRRAPGGAVGLVRTSGGWAAVGRDDGMLDGIALPSGLVAVVS